MDAGGEDIPIDVVYADRELVVVNKAAGMVVHPAAGHRRGTLLNAILHRFPAAQLPGSPERAGIVHRLDRDTSGLIVVARTVEAHEGLARQFRERRVIKEYLALVAARVRDSGEIDEGIGRHPRDRKKMSTSARRARSAVTVFEPLEQLGPATLLLVRPRTGRTHQIRVHLAARGMPVVGDRVYGASAAPGPRGRGAGKAAAILGRMERQALHAWKLELSHPSTGRSLALEAPLPPDMASVLEDLRGTEGG